MSYITLTYVESKSERDRRDAFIYSLSQKKSAQRIALDPDVIKLNGGYVMTRQNVLRIVDREERKKQKSTD